MKELPEGREHGTSWAYQYGKCRCDACRGWKRDEVRRRRGSVLVGAGPVDRATYNRAVSALVQRHRDELQLLIADMTKPGGPME